MPKCGKDEQGNSINSGYPLFMCCEMSEGICPRPSGDRMRRQYTNRRMRRIYFTR